MKNKERITFEPLSDKHLREVLKIAYFHKGKDLMISLMEIRNYLYVIKDNDKIVGVIGIYPISEKLDGLLVFHKV
jgi:hypothetical protein